MAKGKSDCACGFDVPHTDHIDLAAPMERPDGTVVETLPDLRGRSAPTADLLEKVVLQNERLTKLQALNAPEVIATAEADKLQRLVMDLLVVLDPRTQGSPRRSKDPLTAAITSVLEPALSEHGFKRFGGRAMGRLRDGALQFVLFDRYLHTTTSCSLHYNTVPLYRPNSSLNLAPPGSTLEGAWRFSSHSLGDASMSRALAGIEQEALPWLEQTATTEGLLRAFEESRFRPAEGVTFSRACCLARLDRVDEANELLREEHYQSWWLEGDSGVVALRTALQDGEHRDLQARWIEDSIVSLKLTKFMC